MRARRAHPGVKKSMAYPRCDFYCVSGITPAAKNRCVPRRVWPPGSAVPGTLLRGPKTPNVTPLTENNLRRARAAPGAGAWRGNRHPVRSRRREKRTRYAREHNLGKNRHGPPASRRWWRRAFADRLAVRAPISIRHRRPEEPPPARALAQTPDNRPLKSSGVGRFRAVRSPWRFAPSPRFSSLAQWLVTFDAANLVMPLFAGGGIAFILRWPSVVATVINVASFDLSSRHAVMPRRFGRAVFADLCCACRRLVW